MSRVLKNEQGQAMGVLIRGRHRRLFTSDPLAVAMLQCSLNLMAECMDKSETMDAGLAPAEGVDLMVDEPYDEWSWDTVAELGPSGELWGIERRAGLLAGDVVFVDRLHTEQEEAAERLDAELGFGASVIGRALDDGD